jgi:hypothetical protein
MANELDIDAMIAAYEAKIAAMQEAVSALKKARDALGGSGLSAGGRTGGGQQLHPDSFVGMSIVEASAQYLRIVGRPARSTEEIVDALVRGGLQRVSPASVATLLIREHNNEGPVVRVQKGFYGLAEWYPRRPPKLKRAGTVTEGKTVEDVVEEGLAEGATAEEMIDEVVEITQAKPEGRVPRTPIS